MRRLPAASLILTVLLAGCGGGDQAAPEVDLFAPDMPRHHITGCNEAGELEVATVNVWLEPGGVSNTNRPVGKLSGDGREDLGLKCQGSVVVVVQSQQAEGRTFYRVASVVRGDDGWVSESFIGRQMEVSRCAEHFSDRAQLARCEGRVP